jgi:hypothetical protein
MMSSERNELFTDPVATEGDTMAKENSTSKPTIRQASADGLPHPKRDADNMDAGAKPPTPKTAGTSKPPTAPLDNPVANRNAGRPRQPGTTPRPSEKPLD